MCGLLPDSHFEDRLPASRWSSVVLSLCLPPMHTSPAGYPDRTCELCAWLHIVCIRSIVFSSGTPPSSHTVRSSYLWPPLCIRPWCERHPSTPPLAFISVLTNTLTQCCSGWRTQLMVLKTLRRYSANSGSFDLKGVQWTQHASFAVCTSLSHFHLRNSFMVFCLCLVLPILLSLSNKSYKTLLIHNGKGASCALCLPDFWAHFLGETVIVPRLLLHTS